MDVNHLKGYPNIIGGTKISYIGKEAFKDCIGIEYLSFIDAETIDESAFEGCLQLPCPQSFNGTKLIKGRAFYNCGLESLTQNGDERASSLIISDTIKYIADDAFVCPTIMRIDVDKNNKVYYDYDELPDNKVIGNDCIIERNTHRLIRGCRNSVIPPSVKTIGDYAFYGDRVKNIDIPDGVETIGEWSFANCNKLEMVVIPASVTSIGDNAFLGIENKVKLRVVKDSVAYNYALSHNIKYELLPTGVKLNKEEITLKINETETITPVILPSEAMVSKIKWSTSDSKVVNVSDSGMITAINSGIATITVTIIPGEIQAKCLVYVKENTPKITVNYDTNKLEGFIIGSTYEINGKKIVTEDTSIDIEKSWYETNISIMKVNEEEKCNSDIQELTIEKKIHKHTIIIDQAIEATCTSTGLTEGSHCSECGEKIVEQKIIPKKEHKPTITTTKATMSKNGSKLTRCTVCQSQISSVTIYYPKTISLSKVSYTYDGKSKKPTVTVKDSKGNKITSSNYTVSYQTGRKNVGKYKVVVKFKGNYIGTKNLYFKINPKGTSISKLTSGKKKVTVKLKKQATQTTGYQLWYSTSSKFKNAKTVKITKNKILSKTISKLSAKKKYYVKVRTYKVINGVTYYSEWSRVKFIKTK